MYDIVTDINFDSEKTNNYILSIQVNLDGFSFSVVCAQQKKLLAYKSSILQISSEALIARHLHEWLNSEYLLKKPYQKIFIYCFTERFSLIPEKYFSNDFLPDFAPFLLPENHIEPIENNLIDRMNAKLLFVLPSGVKDVLKNFFSSYELTHPLKPILEKLPETKKYNGAILVNNYKYFYCIFYTLDKVLLANSFNAANSSDVVYYVLNSMQQLNINPGQIELFLSETRENDNNIEKSLKPYFEEIKQLKPSPNLTNPENIKLSYLRYLSSQY